MPDKAVKKNKVLVAMSGGVDSSVAAALLLQQGYDVTGAFIKNWSESKDPETGGCSWRSERRDALRVAATLDIPLLTFDFEKQYRQKIVAELYKGYANGTTPNPDVLCNQFIKFGLFWDQAKKLGFDLMATGHYAIIKRSTSFPRSIAGESTQLCRGLDPDKDQSYFLYRISRDALQHSLMPIGSYKKSQIRALAKKLKLNTANKPDSQGICFIGKVDFSEFLSKKIKNKPGSIITDKGVEIGEHQGLHNYTIGQRSKIAVADKHPWYVAGKDLTKNVLVVVSNPNHKLLQSKELILQDVNWLAELPKTSITCQVQTRYHQEPRTASVKIDKQGQKIVLKFKKPIVSATPGQSAVIYKGNHCLGGGVIRQVKHLC